MNISSNPGLYVHIPFCKSKCGYCDFYSTTDSNLHKAFIQALIEEIKLNSRKVISPADFDTIYIGGGTPSLLSSSEIDLILGTLYKFFPINDHVEITIEVNPGTVSSAKLKEYLHLGINRLSIGIQSFINDELKFLGRIHSTEEAINSIQSAKNAGFENIGIDLIYAIPDQLLSDWIYTLEKTLSFQPNHISAYNLIIEEGTPFFQKAQKKQIKPKSEAEEIKFFNVTRSQLSKAGYIHYEVSNFAKSSKEISRHNYKYWNHTPYLSFGPSAHSFWNNSRWANVRSIDLYIDKLKASILPIDFTEELKEKDLLFEQILLGLRLFKGIDLNKFEKTHNPSFFYSHSKYIEQLVKNKFAILENNHFKLTPKGMLLCDEIVSEFANN